MKRTALIGAGRWGKNILSEFSQQSEVVWVCTKNGNESAKLIQEQYPTIKFTLDLDDILNDSSIEAVAITTPTSTHFEIATKALSSGKHVFLEKPGTDNSENLNYLSLLANEKNLTFMVGYEFVYHPALKKILELTHGSKIYTIETEWHKWGSFHDPIVNHLLCHEISIITHLTKNLLDPIYKKEIPIISSGDILYTDLASEHTKIGCMINRVSLEKRKTVTIISDDKKLIWNDDDLFLIDDTDTTTKINFQSGSAISEEVSEFLRALHGKRSPLTDGEFSLKVYRVLDKVNSLHS